MRAGSTHGDGCRDGKCEEPHVLKLRRRGPRRHAAKAGLHLKLEPLYVAAALRTELPSVTSLQSQWDGYLTGQDLTGLDRDRVRTLGHDYLDRAIVGVDGGSQC